MTCLSATFHKVSLLNVALVCLSRCAVGLHRNFQSVCLPCFLNNLSVVMAHTGHITLEEFIKGAQGDPWIMNMLQLDMNPYGWVLEQRRKSAHF